MDSEVRRFGLVGPLGRLCVVVVSDESGPRDGRVFPFPFPTLVGLQCGVCPFFGLWRGSCVKLELIR